jgi:hypothetical protein
MASRPQAEIPGEVASENQFCCREAGGPIHTS